MCEEFIKYVSLLDVVGFVEVFGDCNLIYLFEYFVVCMFFKICIVYGFYMVSLIFVVFGICFFGFGVIYLLQMFNFKVLVKIGDDVVVLVVVVELMECGNWVCLICICSVGDMVVLEGEVLVKVLLCLEDWFRIQQFFGLLFVLQCNNLVVWFEVGLSLMFVWFDGSFVVVVDLCFFFVGWCMLCCIFLV